MRLSDPNLVALRSKTSLEVLTDAALEDFVGDGETNLSLMEFVSRVSTARPRCARLGRLDARLTTPGDGKVAAAPGGSCVATVGGFPTVGFYGNGEPTVNSNGELTVATAPRNYVDA